MRWGKLTVFLPEKHKKQGLQIKLNTGEGSCIMQDGRPRGFGTKKFAKKAAVQLLTFRKEPPKARFDMFRLKYFGMKYKEKEI